MNRNGKSKGGNQHEEKLITGNIGISGSTGIFG